MTNDTYTQAKIEEFRKTDRKPLKYIVILVGLFFLVLVLSNFLKGWNSAPGQDEFERACFHFTEKYFRACISELDTVLRKTSDHPEAYYLRARARNCLEPKNDADWDLIVRDLNLCIDCEQKPNEVPNWISRFGAGVRKVNLLMKLKGWSSGCRICSPPAYSLADVLSDSQRHAKYFLIEIYTNEELSGEKAPEKLQRATKLFQEVCEGSPRQLQFEKSRLSCVLAEALIRHGQFEKAEHVLDDSFSGLTHRCDLYVEKMLEKHHLSPHRASDDQIRSTLGYDAWLKGIPCQQFLVEEFERLASVYQNLPNHQKMQLCYDWIHKLKPRKRE